MTDNLSTAEQEVVTSLTEYVVQWADAPTAYELANGDTLLGAQFEGWLAALERRGLIRTCGKRVCGRTGIETETWMPMQ